MIDKEMARYLHDLCFFHKSSLLDQQSNVKSTVLLNTIDSELKCVRVAEKVLQRILDED